MSRIALLIPVYNEIEGLYAALYPLIDCERNFDVIVVDDGSEQDIDVDEQQFPFPIVLHRHDKNLGIACALNTGLQYILSRNYEYTVSTNIATSKFQNLYDIVFRQCTRQCCRPIDLAIVE